MKEKTLTGLGKKFALLLLAFALILVPNAVRTEPGARAISAGQTGTYPFATGANAFFGGVKWTAPPAQGGDNWMTLFINFNPVDLSGADYIAIQYRADSGAPGLTFAMEQGGSRYSIANEDGKPVYDGDNLRTVNMESMRYKAMLTKFEEPKRRDINDRKPPKPKRR